MAKEQKPAEAAHSTGDSHAVYPTHYDVKIHTLRPECVDLDIIVGGVDRMGIAGAVGCFGGFLFFCHSVGLLFLNIKMSGLAALGSQGHGHTWFLLRRFQLDRNDGRTVHIVELAAGIVIELDEV